MFLKDIRIAALEMDAFHSATAVEEPIRFFLFFWTDSSR